MRAFLSLSDGTKLVGISFGAEVPAGGEMVLSTAMVGYTESLSDPSYRGQVSLSPPPSLADSLLTALSDSNADQSIGWKLRRA